MSEHNTPVHHHIPGTSRTGLTGAAAAPARERAAELPPLPQEEAKDKPFLPEKAKKKQGSPTVLLVVGGLVVFLFIMSFVLVKSPKKAQKATSAPQAATQSTEQPSGVTPTNEVSRGGENTDAEISAADLDPNKRADGADTAPQGQAAPQQGGTDAKQLGQIPPFQAPPDDPSEWHPTPYNGQQAPAAATTVNAADEAHARAEAVTKPSVVFLRRKGAVAANLQVASSAAAPSITNFGLKPGYQVAVRLEASASTSTLAPVTAIVEYNYLRNGTVLIPAGSRAIGIINSADSSGNMSLAFSSIDLPNGTSVAISAVGVSINRTVLKGDVTGKNRRKGMLIATLSGIGQAAATLVGNDRSSAYTENDMLRERVIQNAGNATDMQIARMMNSENVTVTLPAGTQFYLVFTAPAATPAATPKAATPAPAEQEEVGS